MQQSTEETSADGKDGIPTDTIVDHVEAVHTRTRAHTRGQLHAWILYTPILWNWLAHEGTWQ
jgi:hypothetical protein